MARRVKSQKSNVKRDLHFKKLSSNKGTNSKRFDLSNKVGRDDDNFRYWDNWIKNERSQKDLFQKIREERRKSKITQSLYNQVKYKERPKNGDEKTEQNHMKQRSTNFVSKKVREILKYWDAKNAEMTVMKFDNQKKRYSLFRTK